MSRTLDQYDGARLRSTPRAKTYRVTSGDGSVTTERFTQAQATAHGTQLEPDGIPLDAAIRMVSQWNTQAARQGNALRYAIPFVKSALTAGT